MDYYFTCIPSMLSKHKLSANEYNVIETINFISKNPRSKVPGYCLTSKEKISKLLYISRTSVEDVIKKRPEFLEVHPSKRGAIRPTKLWHSELEKERKKIKLKPSENCVESEQSEILKENELRGIPTTDCVESEQVSAQNCVESEQAYKRIINSENQTGFGSGFSDSVSTTLPVKNIIAPLPLWAQD